MNAEETHLLALEIARDEFELKLRAAERRAAEELGRKRKMARKQQLTGKARDAEARREALREVPCDVWLPRLTGIEVPNGRRVPCPLPGHDDATEPNCRFYTVSFYCWSCNRGGDVFVFAGELWDIDPKTRFPELVKLLAERLL